MKVHNRFRSLSYGFLLVVCGVVLANCGVSGDVRSGVLRAEPKSSFSQASVDETSRVTAWRPTQRNSIPFVMNDPVKRWVNTFSGSLKTNFDRWISRLGQYGPTIEHILDEEGVPRDLIYLAMIESGFNLKAYSSAAAAGPWQFISSTGRMYGLENGPFLDERRDVIKATRAAARHLKDLHKIYGDWYLAFAAYNAGSGKVNSAIKKTGTSDYWTIASPRSRALRQETKDYVPKVLAALYIVKNYHKFGYSEAAFGPPMEYDRVTVPDATDVSVIAKCSGTTAEKISELNPALTIGITTPSKEVEVFIPKGAKEEFQRRYSQIPVGQRVASLTYTVGHKETLHSLSKRFGVSSSKIAAMNGISGKQKLTPGQSLTVPASSTALLALASGQRGGSSKSPSQRVVYHKVKKGETLSTVARRYGASSQELASWNKLGKKPQIRVGQKLKIYRETSGDRPILAALPPQYAGKRMSGVAHIIALDEQTPTDLALEDDNKIELPVMIAQTGTTLSGITDQPAEVRTEENIQDYTIAGGPDVTAPSSVVTDTLDAEPTTVAALMHDENNIPTPQRKPAPTAAVFSVGTEDERDDAAINNQPQAPSQMTKTQVKYYTVKKGDTLLAIAKQNRVGLTELKSLNKLTGTTVKVGQRLVVAKKTVPVVSGYALTQSKPAAVSSELPASVGNPASTFAPQPVVTNQKIVYHRVKAGESLWSVSRRYSVTVADIKKWNGLVKNEVQPNQKLKIMSGTAVVSRKKFVQLKTVNP